MVNVRLFSIDYKNDTIDSASSAVTAVQLHDATSNKERLTHEFDPSLSEEGKGSKPSHHQTILRTTPL